MDKKKTGKNDRQKIRQASCVRSDNLPSFASVD